MLFKKSRKFASIALLTASAVLISPPAIAQNALVADAGFSRDGISACKTDLRYLNQVTGWQVGWPRQWAGVAAAESGFDQAAAHWSGAPKALGRLQNNLQRGIKNHETAPRAVVLRITQQVSDLASDLEQQNPRYFNGHDDAAAWNAVLHDDIAPALRKFHAFLEETYLPAAKTTPGLSEVENGKACFERAATHWTTLPLTQEEIEAIGNKLLETTRADLIATGQDGESFAGIMARLRAQQDTDATSEEELIAISQAALDRAQDNVLRAFSKAPPRNVVIELMAEHLRGSAPAGYYRAPEGGAPAGYIINPSRPGERRLMAEVIAFHEGVPGHHLFFDYPRTSPSSGFNAGLLEGWGLYAEYVADEMGLYSSTLDRQGMMAKHLWAASRLIVEPGLHLRGWSRDDAIKLMLENTLMARAEIEIEVDRYIAMPGHSLSYMVGADVLLTGREEARAILGEAFDIKAFHDVVLLPGVRTLPQVRDDIRNWANGVVMQ